MASIKRDDNKQSWENDTEFPLVCETCLGDNPYVRMTKEEYGKKCQICENPFTVFAWQAGTKGRLKRVEICKLCAQAKNVCQVCIYDLQYGLPVKVRDKILREAGSALNTAPGSAVPQSNANRAWYTAQQQRLIDNGQNLIGDGGNVTDYAHAKLSEMARMEPRYERNLAKLCSFFARGECNRGANCPFRHEMPIHDRSDPMVKQNTKNRFYGTSDPVANKILGRKRRQDEQEQKQAEQEEGYEKARSTLFIRFQGNNNDNNDVNDVNDQQQYPKVSERDVRDAFYSFGEIVSVRIISDKGYIFVEYTQPEATELAIMTMNKKELLGRPIYVLWARAPKRGEHHTNNNESSKRYRDDDGNDTEITSAASGNNNNVPLITNVKIKPLAPGNGSVLKDIPSGFKIKPPPHLAAIAAARKKAALEQQQQQNGGDNDERGTRQNNDANTHRQPYYPSADSKRLGT
jgi:pre-mRNA-splicing factor RBM22/SLT11